MIAHKKDAVKKKKCKEVRGRPAYIARNEKQKSKQEVCMIVGLVIAALGLGIAAASAGGDGQ